MNGYFFGFICLSALFQCYGLPVDPTDADTNPTPGTMTPAPAVPPKCPAANFDCNSCLAVSGCIFVDHKDSSLQCVSSDDQIINSEGVETTVVKTADQCQSGGEPDVTTVTPSPDPTSSTTTENPDDPSTSTTTTTTTTTTSDSTQTTTTLTTTTVSTTTTTTSESTPGTSTPGAPVTPIPTPEDRGHFDGWSFFGGILLTLGAAAIGFVGFKYYKLRSTSGSGGNYNRF